jgi:hypothetical protein
MTSASRLIDVFRFSAVSSRAGSARAVTRSGDTETPMNPGAARGERRPEQVVDTAWRALGGTRPSVVDGRANSVLATLSSRVLRKRTALRIAERMMRAKG